MDKKGYAKRWWRAAAIRTAKTFGETLAAGLATIATFGDFSPTKLPAIFYAAGIAAAIAFLTCVKWLPEVSAEFNNESEDTDGQ